MAILTSKWDKLNPLLVARFYEVDKGGNRVGGVEVHCPLSEAEIDINLQWQSPFENMGAEAKAPAMLSMLQTGALQPVLAALKGNGAAGMSEQEAKEKQQNSNGFLQQFEGRSGITKLNSTQVFAGMPPAKFTVTAVFRAWDNARQEVNAPVDQLVTWALPKELSPDGAVVKSINAAQGSTDPAVEILMPSLAPVLVALEYKGKVYAPLVIESIGIPLESPVDASGGFVHIKLPITLETLTAIDGKDWRRYSR